MLIGPAAPRVSIPIKSVGKQVDREQDTLEHGKSRQQATPQNSIAKPAMYRSFPSPWLHVPPAGPPALCACACSADACSGCAQQRPAPAVTPNDNTTHQHLPHVMQQLQDEYSHIPCSPVALWHIVCRLAEEDNCRLPEAQNTQPHKPSRAYLLCRCLSNHPVIQLAHHLLRGGDVPHTPVHGGRGTAEVLTTVLRLTGRGAVGVLCMAGAARKGRRHSNRHWW